MVRVPALAWVTFQPRAVVLMPEAMLDGGRIEDSFPAIFLDRILVPLVDSPGSLPQHSVTEFRRYMGRFLYLFPDLSDMRA